MWSEIICVQKKGNGKNEESAVCINGGGLYHMPLKR